MTVKDNLISLLETTKQLSSFIPNILIIPTESQKDSTKSGRKPPRNREIKQMTDSRAEKVYLC